MKPYSAKRAERKLRESLKSAATAKFAEGKGIRAEAIEAFKRPPYQLKKGKRDDESKSGRSDRKDHEDTRNASGTEDE